MKNFDINRRRVLAGIGGTGLAAFAGLGLATRESLAYPDQMVMTSNSSFTLEADWRETYNGTVLENTLEDKTENEPAVISLGDIKPGDEGTFSFRLQLQEGDPDIEPPELSVNLESTAENGINEPERQAGDSSPNDGELEETLQVKLWYDDGPLGTNNATQGSMEDLIDQDADGTLEYVANNVNGVPLDKNLTNGCFTTDDQVIVSFEWKFPESAGNVTQSDSVTFTFEITSELCDN